MKATKGEAPATAIAGASGAVKTYNGNELPMDPNSSSPAHGWPFPGIERARFDGLDRMSQIEIQGVIRYLIERFEAECPPAPPRRRLAENVVCLFDEPRPRVVNRFRAATGGNVVRVNWWVAGHFARAGR